jgi:hypothetical protein
MSAFEALARNEKPEHQRVQSFLAWFQEHGGRMCSSFRYAQGEFMKEE